MTEFVEKIFIPEWNGMENKKKIEKQEL